MRRECHACGAETTPGRCDECHAAPWTDYPAAPDRAVAWAAGGGE